MTAVDLLISAFASVGLTAASLWVAGRFLSEKLFGHWLDGRLQRQKEAHELRLAELKSEQDRQIETLRGDIGHLQDRGKHSNEREYAALTEIWEKFYDLHTATNNSVMGFVAIYDLEQMDDDGVADLLDRNNLTNDEREAVRNAANKDNAFSLVMNRRLAAQARSAYSDFRARFDKQNIFIPKALADNLYKAADKCLKAVLLRNPGALGRDEMDFLKQSPEMLRRLNDAVRERLHRE